MARIVVLIRANVCFVEDSSCGRVLVGFGGGGGGERGEKDREQSESSGCFFEFKRVAGHRKEGEKF